jgi:hypothetical protein
MPTMELLISITLSATRNIVIIITHNVQTRCPLACDDIRGKLVNTSVKWSAEVVGGEV